MVFFTKLAEEAAFLGASATSSSAAQATGNATKEFFKDLAHNPFSHFIAVVFFCAIVIIAIAGIAYLVKKVYDKHCAQQNA